jgi:hypothetical protein
MGTEKLIINITIISRFIMATNCTAVFQFELRFSAGFSCPIFQVELKNYSMTDYSNNSHYLELHGNLENLHHSNFLLVSFSGIKSIHPTPINLLSVLV